MLEEDDILCLLQSSRHTKREVFDPKRRYFISITSIHASFATEKKLKTSLTGERSVFFHHKMQLVILYVFEDENVHPVPSSR